MTTSKPVKIYTLFDGICGPTPKTQHYSHGVPIYLIAAVSIKQAYALFYKRVDFNGKFGIVERSLPNCNNRGDGWVNCFGEHYDYPKLKHGSRLPKSWITRYAELEQGS